MGDSEQIQIGGYRLGSIIRRVRRAADMSQRELADHAAVSPSVIAEIETGVLVPTLATLNRVLGAAKYELVVVDEHGRLVLPLEVWQDVEDGSGRRYPAHLDTILDPVFGEWWADGFGLARPPETFRRNRVYRDYERRRSQWEVRVSKLRDAPEPRLPPGWRWADRLRDDRLRDDRLRDDRLRDDSVDDR